MPPARRLALALAVLALAPAPPPGTRVASAGPGAPPRVAARDSLRRFDANRLDLWTTNFGSLGANLDGAAPGLVFPRGSGQTAVYAAGLWVGARVAGGTRVALAEYTSEWRPGSVLGLALTPADAPEWRTWKVRPAGAWRAAADSARLATNEVGADPLVHEGWDAYRAAVPLTGAPLRPVRLPVPGSPGDSAWTMGPDLPGDLALWSVFNDADAAAHTSPAGGTPPLGLEVRQTVFGFDTTPGAVAYVRWEIFHRGTAPLDSAFVAFWIDPDVGGGSDDLVGFDPALQMGYAYNATAADAVYGTRSPAVGVRLLAASTGNRAGGFAKYIGGTDPATPLAAYDLMRGRQVDGAPWVDPVTHEETRFPFAGDPVAGTGWLDTLPADRRFLVSVGPFDLVPGDSATFLFALAVGQGFDRLDSIRRLRCQAGTAGDSTTSGAVAPYPARLALVEARGDDAATRLEWSVTGANPRPLDLLRHAGPPVVPWPGAYELVARLDADASGHLRHADPPLPPGETWTYGLFDACDPLRPLAEAAVTNPDAPFAFRAVSPATGGDLTLRFTLPADGPVRVEAFAVDGRRRLARDLGILLRGPHLVSLPGTGTWPAGLYVLRLSVEGATGTARAVVLR